MISVNYRELMNPRQCCFVAYVKNLAQMGGDFDRDYCC